MMRGILHSIIITVHGSMSGPMAGDNQERYNIFLLRRTLEKQRTVDILPEKSDQKSDIFKKECSSYALP